MHAELIAVALAMLGRPELPEYRIEDLIALLPRAERRQLDEAADRAIEGATDPAAALAAAEREARGLIGLVRARFA